MEFQKQSSSIRFEKKEADDFVKHSKTFSQIKVLSFLFPILIISSPTWSETKLDETKPLLIETNTEIVSDFLWRGNSFAGEAENRRNGATYQSFTYAPALQPSINVWSPEKNSNGPFLEISN